MITIQLVELDDFKDELESLKPIAGPVRLAQFRQGPPNPENGERAAVLEAGCIAGSEFYRLVLIGESQTQAEAQKAAVEKTVEELGMDLAPGRYIIAGE